MDVHKLANKFVTIQSKSPLLHRRMAKVIDWWANVVLKIQSDHYVTAYQYRVSAYHMPLDDKLVYVNIDDTNYIIHDSEIDEESVTYFPNNTSWQAASIAVLSGSLDIVVRRLSGEDEQALATDYHGSDYELHPLVLRANEALVTLFRNRWDATESSRQTKDRIDELIKQRAEIVMLVNQCVNETKMGLSEHCPDDLRRNYLGKVLTLLLRINGQKYTGG